MKDAALIIYYYKRRKIPDRNQKNSLQAKLRILNGFSISYKYIKALLTLNDLILHKWLFFNEYIVLRPFAYKILINQRVTNILDELSQ